MRQDANEWLERRGIKPTPNRILVWRELERQHHPVSMADLQIALDSIDKSSIFRVLSLFVEHDVAHVVDDGTGSAKYELCRAEGECTPADRHVHFHCRRCGDTFCLEHTEVPEVKLPDGFVASEVNYVIKGLCPRCAAREGLQPGCS